MLSPITKASAIVPVTISPVEIALTIPLAALSPVKSASAITRVGISLRLRAIGITPVAIVPVKKETGFVLRRLTIRANRTGFDRKAGVGRFPAVALASVTTCIQRD